ncbi:MAG: transporter substrate-binding domain-containing protein [Clostridiaceae bacterium]|nr:transporter substrate-binding domain-containing protein [Clostridiaceae bacterium]
MKKLMALVLAALMLFTMAACGSKTDGDTTTAAPDDTQGTAAAENSDLAYIKGNGKMIIGITEYAPMNYLDEAGNWTGFDTEFAEAVCAKLGVTPEFFVLADWDAKTNELNAKTIDCVWNGMTITEDLKDGMDISVPYVINAQVIVCKADDAEKYATVESIADAKIAVEGGSAAEKLVAELGYNNVTAVTAQSDALLEVKSGAADVAVIDITMAKAMTGEGTSYEDFTYTASLSEEEYGIGFRKGSDACTEVNAIIAELMADGTLDALAEKYELTLVK